MSINSCRVCGKVFFEEPLLHYNNMPKAAQNFPELKELADEKGVDLTVYQCSACGLVQLSNDPVDYYREVIRAAACSNVIRELKLKQFADFIERFSLHDKKIIEFGCGHGEFLSLLNELNIDAYGIEYSESAVADCQANGLKVSRAYIENNLKLENAPFDAFIFLMFLEHMPDPNSALRGIYNNLSDGAVGIIEVPNFDMMLRNKLFSEFIGDHLLYFSRETLQTTLQLNGFDVLECYELRDDYVISAIVRKRQSLDITNFYNYQEKIKCQINDYIDKFAGAKIAIWGAGHQALAIISMTEIAEKICYVIDSASFKQNKYTPATHLPIFSPDKLNYEPVEAIIVMAASYSDEVVGIIEKDFNDSVKIAVLRDYGLEIIGT